MFREPLINLTLLTLLPVLRRIDIPSKKHSNKNYDENKRDSKGT
jgi:hypothetical protein